MKKLIALCLVALMCISILASCTIPGIGNNESSEPQGSESSESVSNSESDEPSESESKSEESESESDPAPTYDVEAAKENVKALYKNLLSNPSTGKDFTVTPQVMIAGEVYTVTWTVNTDKIAVVVDETAKTVTIDIDEDAIEDVAYVLTATITAPDGTSATLEFNLTMPKFKFTTFAEYAEAEDGAFVTVTGIVTGVFSKATGSQANGLYIQDLNNEGGYYVYNLTDDPNGVILPGMTVVVRGDKDLYNGTYEIINASVQVVDETIKTVEPIDYTEILAGAEKLNDAALVTKQALLVTVKGVTILEAGDNGYYYFQLGEHKVYLRISSSNNATTSEAIANIKAIHAANYGNVADVTGVISIYSGNFYLSPVSADAFSNIKVSEKTDAEKVEAELKNLTIVENVTENTTVELPLVGNFYDDVKIAWTIDNEAYTIDENGKLAIALADEQVKLTLTATITCGEETKTATYTIIVKAKAKGVYVGEHVANPVAGTAYKFYLTAKDGKNYYFNGLINGKFLQTSTNIADGVDVYLEAVLNGETVTGYRFYFDNSGVKTYIDITADGKATLVTENPVAVFNYVADTNCWAATIGENTYYLGTYSNYNTIGASATSYITAENTGKSQFPANFATAIAATYVPQNEKAPVAGTAYKFYLTAKDGKNYYFNGIISGKFLQTSTNIADGVDVYLEAVLEGETTIGYRFYFDNAGVKTYIDITTDGKATLVTENPAAVFNYVAETNCWAATIGENAYYLGTYSSYTTIGASATSYIKPDNTGKSQFPANFASVSVAPVGPSDVTAPEAETAYKFYLTAKDGKNYYFNGIISGKFLQTTTDIHQGIDVFIEAVLNGETVTGYRFYFDNAGVKTYIDITTDGKATLVTENPAAVFNYVAETNCWAATIGENAYYLGTYSSYTTIGASATSYIKPDNTGKSQFPAGFATIVVIEEDPHVCVFADATCVAPKTCECGKTEGEALGHNIVENVCQNCDAKVVTVTEAADLEDGTLVLINATVSKITYNWSDSNKNMSVDITDGTTTLNAYKLGSKVGAGDVIYVYGKVDSHNGKKQIVDATATVVTAHTCTEFTDATCTTAKACTVCGTTQGEALGHNYVDGACDRCGAKKPASTTYTFADYTAGEQYAANEVHKLDDNVTVTTTDAHFTTQIRLYKNDAGEANGQPYDAREGIAVFAMSSAVKSLSINAGGKANPIAVYGSTDGENWTLITTIEATSTYTDYPIELGETAYTFIKLAATKGQARVASITVELQ